MIATSHHNAIAVIRLSDGKRNAIDVDFCRALSAELTKQQKSDARAVVLTADGPYFSAGVDLLKLVEGGESYVRELLPAFMSLLRVLFEFEKPLIAALSGHAVGGGCAIAVTADYRVLRPGMKIGLPELKLGIPFPVLALAMVRLLLSASEFRRVIFGAELYEGAHAIEAGLAEEVAADPLERALEVAALWSEIPGRTFAVSKATDRRAALHLLEGDSRSLDKEVERIWYGGELLTYAKAFLERKRSAAQSNDGSSVTRPD